MAGVLLAALAALLVPAGARGASTFYIRGAGAGHGIGMSQYGAYGYALHGADYRAILGHYYQGTALGAVNPERVVRVLVSTGSASFSGATAAGGTPLRRATTYTVTAHGGWLRLRTAAGTALGSFAAPLVVSGAGPLEVPGHGSYRGSLHFSPAAGGVQTVDVVGLDDYVRGVVAEEVPASWPAAVLQAQSVAARTYAITATVSGSGYDLYADARSQAYGGTRAETSATDAAVAATRGQVVTYGGRPVPLYFFASSGGYTESIQEAWPGAVAEPWLQGVPDPYDGAGGDPYHRWERKMSMAAATARLRGLVKGTLVGIRVTRHGVSPRIIAARVVGSRGQTAVSGAQLQVALGLASTWATFTTITTGGSRRRLSGTIYPVPTHGRVTVQAEAGGRWRTVGTVPVSARGSYRATVPAGRYRVVDGPLDGPMVSVR